MLINILDECSRYGRQYVLVGVSAGMHGSTDVKYYRRYGYVVYDSSSRTVDISNA